MKHRDELNSSFFGDKLSKDLFIRVMKHNLQLILQFHNESMRLMGNQVFEIENKIAKTPDRNTRNTLIADKQIYIGTFYEMQRWNTFLMMYSYLEEFFYHLWKLNYMGELPYESGIKRFKPVLERVLKMDLGRDSDWQVVCSYQKLRDCLLHANGRIDLLRKGSDSANLERIVSSSTNLDIKSNHIILTDEFLQEVNLVLLSFIERIGIEAQLSQ